MYKYQIRYTEGKSISNDTSKKFSGLRAYKIIEAPNKVLAFKKFHDSNGLDEITGLAEPYPDGSPLGFSENEMKELEETGILLKDGYPKNGIQVEEIIPKESQ